MHRRLQAEPLESRVLLAGDLLASQHNWLIPADTNDDGQVSPRDALVVINYLNANAEADAVGEARSLATSPEPQQYLDANGDGAVSPRDALFVINELAEGETDTVRYSLRTMDETGTNQISSIGVGQTFMLEVWVDDLREPGTTPPAQTNEPGAFAAYLDVRYASDLAQIAGAVVHNTAEFGNAPHADTSTPGLIDATGSFSKSFAPTTFDAQLLWSVDLQATAAGTLTLMGESTTDYKADGTGDNGDQGQSPSRETLLFGLDLPICPNNEGACIGSMDFSHATINIVEDILAVSDRGSMAEDDTPVTIAILDNDVVNTPEGGTPILDSFDANPANATVANNGSDMLTVTPDADFNGTVSFSYTIRNGEGSTSTGTVDVNVSPVNDGPVNTVPSARTTNEDTTVTVSGISVVDVDADDGSGLSVELTVSDGTLNVGASSATVSGDGNDAVMIDGSVADVNAALSGLTYTPNPDFNGSDTLVIETSDNGNTGSGGTLTDSDSVSITVNPVNDQPVFTIPGSQVVFNTETLSFGSGDFSVSDVDAPTLDVTLGVDSGILTLGTTSGLTVTGNSSSLITLSGTPANLNSGLGTLVYDPVDTFIGEATLTASATDGSLGDGGSVSINVTPPTLPFAASDAFTIEEDEAAPTTLDVLDNDLKPDPQDSNSLSITQLNGVMLTGVGQTDTTANGGTVTYTGSGFTYSVAADFFGTDTFTYTIESAPDAGDGDSTAIVVVDVTPINDGPTVDVPGSKSVAEDNVLSLDSGNPIVVGDIDAGSAGVTVTLSVGDGTLDVASSSLATGNGSSQVTIDGTVSEVNNLLDSLTYTPDLNFNGGVSLSVAVNDNGNTGGGALTASDDVSITVTAVNDGPGLSVPGQQSFITDFDNFLSASEGNSISISDVDAGNADVQVDLTIADGTLTLTDSTDVTVTQDPGGNNGIRLTGPVSAINSALAGGVNYRTTVAGDTQLSVVVNDLGNTGGTEMNPSATNPLTASGSIPLEILDFVPSNLGGYVFVDADASGSKDTGEIPLANVVVKLTGTDFRGEAVDLTRYTDTYGSYGFVDLKPGTYTLQEIQPSGMIDGGDSFDTAFSSVQNDQASITIDIEGGVNTFGNNFGERGLASPFLSLADLLASTYDDSGVLIGQDGGAAWSLSLGTGWEGITNLQIQSNHDGSTTLSATDAASQSQSVVLPANSPYVRSRASGDTTVFRVIGTYEDIFGTDGSGEGEGEGGDALAQADAYRQAVDAIFGDGALFA